MKYTFESLMCLADDELDALMKKVDKVRSIDYAVKQINDKRLFNRLRSWDIIDITKWSGISAAIIIGSYFIGKGLSESQSQKKHAL